MKIKIAQFGLGPIGLRALQLAARKTWAEVVGGIDIDPAKSGHDLGELTGDHRLRGALTFPSLDAMLSHSRPDVILHTAVSKFRVAFDHITPMVRCGINVVSSCEEMVFPQLRHRQLATGLDQLCRRNGARAVATGVNPGFVMDVLPLCLTGICVDVKEVHVQRVVNATTRRESLQRKIGSGLSPHHFRNLLKLGKAGHAGLKESLALIAHGLGWKLDEIRQEGNAVIANHDIKTAFLEVRKGQTCGLHQRAEGRVKGKVCLTLDLSMYLDAESPFDAVRIVSEPPLDLRIEGGIAGDQATVAALISAVPALLKAQPGLLLPTDLPLARFVG